MTDPLQYVVSEIRRLKRDSERQRIRSHERTVWLSTAITHTDWDGDAKNTGTYDIDLSTWGVPANVRAVHVRAAGYWTSANNTYSMSFRPYGGGSISLSVRAQVANINTDNSGWVTCNSTGDIQITVAGANAAGVYVAITGYML